MRKRVFHGKILLIYGRVLFAKKMKKEGQWGNMNKHIVLWAIRDDDEKQTHLEKIRKDILDIARVQDGCLFAEVGFNYNMAADYDLCFIATFKNPPAIKQFINSSDYKKVLKYVDSLDGESIIVDYMPEAESTVDKTPAPEPKTVEVEVIKEVIKEVIVEKPVEAKETPAKKTTRKKTTKTENSSVDIIDAIDNLAADNNIEEASAKKTTKKKTAKATLTSADDVAVAVEAEAPAKKTTRKRTTKAAQSVVDVTEASAATVNTVVEAIVDDVTAKAVKEPVKVQPAKSVRPKVVEPEVVKALQPGAPAVKLKSTETEMDPDLEMELLEAPMKITKAPKKKVIVQEEVAEVLSEEPVITETPISKVKAYELDENGQPAATPISSTPSYDVDDEEDDEDEDELPRLNRANLNNLDDTPLKRIEPKGKTLKEGERAMDVAWRCPACGKYNGAFVGLCGCGARRPDDYIPVSAEELDARLLSDEDFVPEVVYKNNVVPLTLKEINDTLNESIVPAITTTVKKIKTAAGYESDEPKEEIVTAFTELAQNTGDEPEIIRIEPKGVHLEEGQMAMSNAWKCTKCGKINGAFVGLCGCGRRKPKNYTPVSDEELKKYEAAQKKSEEAPAKKVKSSNNIAKNVTSAINNVTAKGMNSLTEAMNNANNLDSGSYNRGLLASENATEEEPLKRIEPKGVQLAEGESAMKNSWTCPRCGKVLASYIGQCGCGMRKNGTEDDDE